MARERLYNNDEIWKSIANFEGMKLAIEEEYARTEEVKLDICIL